MSARYESFIYFLAVVFSPPIHSCCRGTSHFCSELGPFIAEQARIPNKAGDRSTASHSRQFSSFQFLSTPMFQERQHYQVMARNVKLVPVSADDKSQVLRKLEGRPHFEKTLTASTASHYIGKNSGLTLPSWFVQKYGYEFRRSAILRTESSTKAWPVTLAIAVYSLNWIQVRFSGGWRAFAASNGLVKGDSLVFSITAMSEFQVYIFRSAKEGPEGPVESVEPSPAQSRKWTSDNSDRSWKKAKPSFECGDAQLAPVSAAAREGSSEGDVKFNGLDVASASGPHSLTSLRNSLWNYASHDDSTGLQNLTVASRVSLLPGFWKKLTASNICRRDGGGPETACLMIPPDFWKSHGSRIQSVVKLQGIRDECPVRTTACYNITRGKLVRHYLRAEWRAFGNENNLRVGQVLLFTLAADSFFVVREAHQQAPSA